MGFGDRHRECGTRKQVKLVCKRRVVLIMRVSERTLRVFFDYSIDFVKGMLADE